jgi:NAD-dependent deacetylase
LLPEELITALRRARHVCVLTGAGVSAESGVPTFRDAHSGLWARYDPMELATAEAFLRQPELVWRWYRWRRALVADATPNAGHQALAELQQHVPRMTLVTQNVDGLHQRAGSEAVIEFHGNLFANRCFADDCAASVADVGDAEVPTCIRCGGIVRPGVVWFGEAIAEHSLDQSFSAAASCDVFFSIGTSSLVYPTAGLAEAALESGALVVEINPEPTELSRKFHVSIAATSARILPEVINSLRDTPTAS